MVVSGDSSAIEPATAKVNLLIDIQAKIQAGNGPGYERWAKIFNLKRAAQTLIFLQENGLTEYAQLEKKATEATATFNAQQRRRRLTDRRESRLSNGAWGRASTSGVEPF